MSNPVKNYMTVMPHSIRTDLSLGKAEEMMSKYSCHHLPVLEGGVIQGVLSARDVNKFKNLSGGLDLMVEDAMTPTPVIVKPTEDIFQVAMLMHEKKIGSVIVSGDENSSWGIFTSTDALGYFSDKNLQD